MAAPTLWVHALSAVQEPEHLEQLLPVFFCRLRNTRRQEMHRDLDTHFSTYRAVVQLVHYAIEHLAALRIKQWRILIDYIQVRVMRVLATTTYLLQQHISNQLRHTYRALARNGEVEDHSEVLRPQIDIKRSSVRS